MFTGTSYACALQQKQAELECSPVNPLAAQLLVEAYRMHIPAASSVKREAIPTGASF